MKNQIKIKTKKALSLALAVLMVLSAWVWVAPEKAEAATYSGYTVYVTTHKDNMNAAENTHHIVFTFADGSTQDLNWNNAANGVAGEEAFSVNKWPREMYFQIGSKNVAKVRIVKVRINDVVIFEGGNNLSATGFIAEKKDGWTLTSGGTQTGQKTWEAPKVTYVDTAVKAATINVPKTGDASKSFTATFMDQYKVGWSASYDGLTASLSPNIGTVSVSNNVATVKADLSVFDDANLSYNTSTGQGVVKLTMNFGSASTSCNVTYKAPKYDLTVKYYNDTVAKTFTDKGYYKQSVTLTDSELGSNTAANITDKTHTYYKWPDNKTVVLDGNKEFKEIIDNSRNGNHAYGTWQHGDENQHVQSCTVCSYEIKDYHDWVPGKTITAATCTTTGLKKYTCSICERTKEETIKALGHDFTSGVFVNKDGNGHYRKCERCNEYGFGGNVGAVQAHTWDDGVVTTPATCETTGEMLYTCTAYDCRATKTETIPALGHNFNDLCVVKEDGKNGSHYFKCERFAECGAYGVGTDKNDSKPHNWCTTEEAEVLREATCTDDGLRKYSCSDCTATYEEAIPATGHTYTKVVTPPTCTAQGYTTYTCYCGYSYKADFVPVVSHTYDEGKITTDPTCTLPGVMTYTCTVCGRSKTEEIPAAGAGNHNFVEEIVKEPTCTEDGLKKFKCGCDEYEQVNGADRTEVIPMLGHDYKYDVTAPTCTAEGYTTVTCSRCDYKAVEDIVPATGHDFTGEIKNNGNAVDGTHAWACKNGCGEYGYVDAEGDDVVGALAHEWNEGEVTDEQCCNKEGEMLYLCTVEGCGAERTEVIPADGFKNVKKTDALDKSQFCGERGYQAFWTCKKCHKIFKDEALTQEISEYKFTDVGEVEVPNALLNPVTQHEFIDKYVTVVAGKEGTHAKKCVRYDNCKAYDESSVVSHNWSDAVRTDPTHIKDGAETCKCICGDSYADTIESDPLHAYERTEFYTYYDETYAEGVDSVEELGVYTEATCITKGYTIYTCPCGQSKIVYDLEEPSHDFGEWVATDASCTDDGERTRVCNTCGYDETETVPASGHNFSATVEAKAATCKDGGATGNEAYKQCTVCNLYFDADADVKATNGVENAKVFEIAALKHTFFAGGNDAQKPETDTLVSAPTCKAAAVYKVHCDLCGVAAADMTYSYGTAIDHVFEGEIKANDDETHSFACTYGCGTYGGTVACTFDTVSQIENDDVYHNVACACGNDKNELHTFPADWTSVGDGTNTKTCDKCGYIITTACEYVLDEKASVDATCDKDGKKVYVCKDADCDSTYTETVPALGHAWAEVVDADYLKDAATCKADAVYYKSCSVCNVKSAETFVSVGSKLVHDWNEWEQKVVDGVEVHTRTNNTDTCTETAECDGGVANCVDQAVCVVCGGGYGDIDENNHKTIVTVPEVPATCQTAGKEAYRKCDACGVDVEEAVVIPQLAHTYTEWAKVVGEDKHSRYCSTCVENDELNLTIDAQTENCSGGVANCSEKAKCSVCKAEYGAVNPDVHKTEANHLDASSVVAATCQKEGFSGNYVYDCCGVIKKAGSTTDALEHTLVEVAKTPATCIAKGSVTYKCSTCVEDDENGLTVYTKTEELEINPKAHASTETVTVNDVEATCETDGYTGDKYYVCCYDETKTESENRRALAEKGTVIKANGKHTYSAAVPEYMVKAINEVKDDEGNITDIVIVLKDTEPTYAQKVAARRSADNKWYHLEQCSVCKEIKYTACGAYEHTANCVETDTCAVCDGLCSLKKANVHKNIVEVEGTEATCTAEGLESYFKCEGCNKEFLDEAGKKKLDDKSVLVIPVADHDFDTTVTYPGEGENADKTYYRCKNYVSAENPDGCTAVKEVEPDDGGDDDDTPSVDDHEHVWSTDYKVTDEATCTEHGYEALYCTVEGCDAVKPGSYQQVTALGHAWNDGVVTTAATCEAEGVMTYECTRCGETKTEVIEKLGHDWDDGVITVQPTCKEAGVKTFTCKNDASHTYTESIAKGKHVVGDEIIRTEPGTCVKPAINWTACSVCGTEFSSEGEVDLTNHGNIVVVPGKEATCVSDGYTDAKVCSDCKTVIAESVEISHKDVPHHDHNGDGYCDECTFDLFDGSACDCICHKQNGLMKIIYKIIRFFWSIFGMNKSCRCGTVHY